jgi:hypothetical protein
VFLKRALERGRQAGLTPREFEVDKLLIENPKIKVGAAVAKIGVPKDKRVPIRAGTKICSSWDEKE